MASLAQKNTILLILLSIVLLALSVVSFAWYQANRTPATTQETPNNTSGQDQQQPTTPSENNTEATNEYRSSKGVLIRVNSPKTGSIISSPVSINGAVPGTWSFEATFPIDVLNSSRQVMGQGYATLEGEWMTEGQVPFSASVSFDQPGTQTGFLLLKKANASGLPEHDDSVEIPVQF